MDTSQPVVVSAYLIHRQGQSPLCHKLLVSEAAIQNTAKIIEKLGKCFLQHFKIHTFPLLITCDEVGTKKHQLLENKVSLSSTFFSSFSLYLCNLERICLGV